MAMSEESNNTAVEAAAPPQPVKPKAAQPKNVTLVLIGAGSYKNLAYDLGPFKKNQPFSIAKDKADILLKTGLFKTV